MTETLKIIKDLRTKIRIYRDLCETKQISASTASIFCTNVIEVACAISELALLEPRIIKPEE